MHVLSVRGHGASPAWEQAFLTRGHEVVVESDPEAALQSAAGEQSAIIVVDLTDRYDERLSLCRRIRAVPSGAWSVLLAVTNSNQPNVVQETLGAGADDYLFSEDPASVCDIRAAIAEHRVEEKRTRRAMLGELSRAESRLQEILETAPDAVVGCDADGAIRLLNEQAVRMTGYTREELVGRPIEALVPEPYAAAHVEKRRRFFERPTSRPMGVARDLKMRCKNGATIDVDICLGYHRDGDRLIAIAAVRDITERRRMEEELRLAKEATERAYQRMRNEIEAAVRIQQALLPTTLPTPDGVHFAYQYHPCADLGGDALNVFPLDGDHIGPYLLDVSGHGVAAALLSVALARQLSPNVGSSTLLRASEGAPAAVRLLSPAEVVRSLNDWFLANPTEEQYFTMVYAVLDARTLKLRYASAGHPPMILARANGDVEMLDATGIPVGMDEDATYEEQVVSLRPGDRLAIYSDGATEACSEKGEMFGSVRLRKRWTESLGAPLDASLTRIRDVVIGWANGRPDDDVSLLGVSVDDRAPTGRSTG